MAEKKIKLYFSGPDGARNDDVAAETGGGALMQHGEHYEISERLALRLLLTDDWSKRRGKERLTRKVEQLRSGEKTLAELSEPAPQEPQVSPNATVPGEEPGPPPASLAENAKQGGTE